MQIALNGAIPTIEQVKQLFKRGLPDLFEISEDTRNYEGNIEFDALTLQWGDDELVCAGYNGLWEMNSYDRLRKSAQKDLLNDILEWIKDEYKMNERIEGNVELFDGMYEFN